MKTIQEFLSYLRSQDVKIWADDDRLRINAPEGTLTPNLRAQLTERKTEILAFLQEINRISHFADKSITPAPRPEELPLSTSQERLWFLDQLEGPGATYNMPVAFHITGPFDISVFEQSINEIIRRHEVLRTSFKTVKGKPVQVIAPELTINIPVIDLQQLPEPETSSKIQQIIIEETQKPFDLKKAPLLRVVLLRPGTEGYVLILTMHHIISDGWSGYIFTQEMAALYNAFSRGEPSPLPELPIQYADFAIWEREWLQKESLEAQINYWKERLSEVPTVLEIPTDFPRPQFPTYKGAKQHLQLPQHLSEKVKDSSLKEGVTLFMFLCAVFQTVLYKYSGQEDFVIGTSDANRYQKEIEPLIGFFVNQVLIPSDFHDDPTIQELLQRVRQGTLGAYENKLVPFSLLVQKVQLERDPSRNPLFQVLFILQNLPELITNLGETLKISPIEIPIRTSRLDSMVSIADQEQGLHISWEYSTDLFEDKTIRMLLETYQNFLEEFVNYPEKRISEIGLPEELIQKVERARQRQSPGKNMKLHHLGFACRDIEKGIQYVKMLYDVKYISDIVFDDLQDASLCLIETNNNVTIELVAGSEVESLLHQGVILYQTCYEVPDIFEAIKDFKAQGAVLVSEPKPAKLFNNRLVAFLNTELGLIEFLESTLSERTAEIVRQFRSSVPETQKHTLAIAATFTAEPIEESLAFWMQKIDIPAKIVFAPYNQVFQELLNPSGILSKNKRGINIVLVRFEDWQKYKGDSETKQNVNDFVLALKSAAERSSTPYLVCVCPASPAMLAETNCAEFFQKMEEQIVSELRQVSGMSVVTSSELTATYPVVTYYDPQGDKLGHIPFTPEFFTALGTMLVRKFHAIKRTPYKVIVLDCDGTLWKGVCGEDGPFGIELDAPHKVLQEFMVEQYKAGMLLCLCSKNNEADVLEVFECRPEMPLKKEHLVSKRLNWQPKSTNIHALAEELQLGLDSFIFVDDSPIECGETQANCPEVLTLQLPQEPERIPKFLQHIWAFDHIKVTEEDKRRTELYQQNIQRERFQKESLTFRDFLTNLDLHIHIAEMIPDQLPRVSQLTQRTNQFNMTTIRRTEREIQALLNSGKYECLVTEVSDRFGEYGLVGVMIFETQANSINVDTFLLSCRALGRGVEHQMLAYLGGLARERGLNTIKVPYLPTQKNQPAIDFLEHIGVSYKAQGDTGWIFNFPTEIAAALTYSPEIEVPQTSSFAPADKLQAGRQWSREISQIFTEIATELYDAKNILKAIRSQKRQARPDLKEGFVAPRTPVEEVVVGIWSEVLGIEGVGVYDNFFNLGGHSLLGTQVISRVNEAFQVELPLQSLFSARTVAGLAEQIETTLQTGQRITSLPLRSIPRDGDLPLSFAQQRLWFLQQLVPDSPFYNIPAAVSLAGQLNVDTLTQCLNEVVRRHEALRTNFVTVDGQPVQVISPALHVSLPVVDLQHLSKEERSLKLQRLLAQEVQCPFDIAADSLLRVTLFRLETEEHVLLLTIHHIVSDGWSMGVFIQEAVALYKAFSQGEHLPTFPLAGGGEVLPELPIQYVDFAHWQRQWLTGEVLQTQLNYWKRQLTGSPPILELPTDRPRPPIQTFRGSTEYVKIRSELTKQLRTLCQQSEVTLFMALLAAFATLLFRYSGQEDILIGSPIANRNRREIEPLIGFFVNTLVLRVDLSENPTFQELLAQVRQVALDAYTHQDFPFDRLVEEIRPERHLNQNPLVQVVFAFQNMPIQPWNLPDLRLSPFEFDSGITKFDLEFYLWEESEGLNGYFVYNADLFDTATITRMINHFQTLLKGIVANPQQHISELSLLTDAERHQILIEWNDTGDDYPKEICVHKLFEAQVEQTPDAVAVVFEDAQLTYRDLNCRANQLSHYLRTLDVGPEVLVGICLERSLEMIIAILGTLKAGGAYVPLDPAYPEERQVFMLKDAQVPVLLTQEKLKLKTENWKLEKCNIVCLDTDWSIISHESKDNLVSNVTVDNLAYAIYTSGSTGKPKGVLIPHKGLLNLVFWHLHDFEVTSSDRATQLAGIAFDASVWEVWPYLTTGAVLCLIGSNTLDSPEQLRDWLISKEISISFVPTPLAEELLSLEWPKSIALRIMLTGGDKLHKYPPASIPFKLVNNYGPTENSVVSTSGPVVSDGNDIILSPSIGRPISNTQIYILDRYHQPVPIGIPGELHVGGDSLARGYLNRPDLTREKFIPNPFSEIPGDRLYKTGDLARYLPDGNIEFLGRIDYQVKIRGFRIELGEIEATLSQHPAVRETVTVVREDRTGKRLVAYVVETKSEAQRANGTELREYLKTKLPEYMIPSAFVMLEALPLTPNGKVDRHALPAPERSGVKEEYVAPRTPSEELLAKIWAEVLELKQVGIHDNFFEIGGDSILSIQITARANQGGLQLSPGHLFQYQTIAELAAVAEESLPIQAEQGIVTGSLPLTPIQHWFFEQNLPEPHHFNQSILLEVPPDLQPDLLEQVIQQLLVHHDALRLRFLKEDSVWQRSDIGPEGIVPFTKFDFSERSSNDQQVAFESAAADLQGSLNLTEGPLMRVVLFHFGPDTPGRLLLVIHHLAIDGVSWRILLEDLQTAYQQLSQGKAIQLPSKTTSFKEWASRLTEYSQSEVLISELDYWLDKSWANVVPLPVDYSSKKETNTVASTARASNSLNIEQTRALLQEVHQAYNTQINDVLLTALVQTFARWTGEHSLLVDLEGHGREQLFEDVSVSRTVGWFTTIFPSLLELGEIGHPGEVLKSIKEQLRQIPNRGIGYGLLRYLNKDNATRQKLRALPHAEISFNYLGQLDQVLSESPLLNLSRESIGPVHSPLGQRRYLLEINGFVVEGKLQLEWTYSKNFHQQTTIERLAREFMNALQSLIAHCQSSEAGGYTPSDFPNVELSQEQLDQVLAEIDEEIS